MSIHFYAPLYERARELRKQQTKAESMIWQQVRNRKCLGFKFYRQRVILGYIVDFYCAELRLIIEIDGDVHLREEQKTYDKVRSSDLESRGLTILRYTNDQIFTNLSDVLEDLKKNILFLANPPLGNERGLGGELG